MVLQEAFISHPQGKEQSWSRGSEKGRRVEDGSSKQVVLGSTAPECCRDSKYEGQPGSPRQRVSFPRLGFLLHLLPTVPPFLSFTLTPPGERVA